MNSERHGGRDFTLITCLLIVFLIVAYYSEQASQTFVEQKAASTLNAHPLGAKALYVLFETVPYKVNRLQTSWLSLGSQDALIVVVEKLADDRQPTLKEITALRTWTQNGGTVLYFVDLPARALDPKNTLAGDAAIIDANDTPDKIAPTATLSPYTQQVGSISISSKVRLKPSPTSHYETLFADKYGAIVIHKPLGRGHVLLVANTHMVRNGGSNEADNVVFLTNVAHVALSGRQNKESMDSKDYKEGIIQFDEYHHGVGFDNSISTQQTIISTLALPLKRAAWPCIALLLILVYNANRRFGIALPLTSIPYRPSTDYVLSMARWYQRARASDIALQTIYNGFLRSLSSALGVAPETPISEIMEHTAQCYPHEAQEISAIVHHCEQLKAGTPLPDAELLAIVRQLEQLTRRIQLVGKQ